jgi:hypothetical protein
MLPAVPGTVTDFVRDTRAMTERVPAHDLMTATGELTVRGKKLAEAYAAMRKLSQDKPDDPRGLTQQGRIHCWYCGRSGQDIHGTRLFVPWHRAYLYFHERILGKLVGDMSLRLPYWSWDVPSNRAMPPAYSISGALSDSTRELPRGGRLPEEDVNERVIQRVLSRGAFAEFSRQLEGTPHGAVHIRVGGRMGHTDTAAVDPIFYAHHVNVDRFWPGWLKAMPGRQNPSDQAFLNETFVFFNEEGRRVRIRVGDVLQHEQNLAYRYRSLPADNSLRLLISRTQRLTLSTHGMANVAGIELPASPSRILLSLQGLELPSEWTGIIRFFADRTPGETATAQSPGYLGYLAVLGNPHRDHGMHTQSVVLDATGVLQSDRNAGELKLTAVRVDRQGGVVAEAPVRATLLKLEEAEGN